MVSKYGKASQNEVKKEMRRYKKGTAHSGPKLKKVESREQAIAIALSKARKKGEKVPPLKKKTSKVKKSSSAATASQKKKSPRKKAGSTTSKRRVSTKTKAKAKR